MRTFTSNFDHQESFMPGQEMEAAVQWPVASVAIITPSKKTVVTNEIGSGGGVEDELRHGDAFLVSA